MNDNIVPFEGSSLPTEYDDKYFADDNNLSEGVGGAMPIVSIKGSRFRVKYGDDETILLNSEGDARTSLEVVIIASKGQVSKIFYKEGYTEGDAEAPDCWSLDGVVPDPSAENKQHLNCAGCPQNQWGSRITDAGKKAKNCSDYRRLAIVPANDIPNELYGGPMLLRVPAASLQDLKRFSDGMKAQGHNYKKIVTRIGFDMEVAYPKLTWGAVRALDMPELRQVITHLESDAPRGILDGTGSVVADGHTAEAPAPAGAVSTTFEQPPEAQGTLPLEAPAGAPAELTPAQKAAATRKANKAKKDAEAAAEAPAVVSTPAEPPAALAGDPLNASLDNILAGLDK